MCNCGNSRRKFVTFTDENGDRVSVDVSQIVKVTTMPRDDNTENIIIELSSGFIASIWQASVARAAAFWSAFDVDEVHI